MTKNPTAFERLQNFKTERSSRLQAMKNELENLDTRMRTLDEKYQRAVFSGQDDDIRTIESEQERLQRERQGLQRRIDLLESTDRPPELTELIESVFDEATAEIRKISKDLQPQLDEIRRRREAYLEAVTTHGATIMRAVKQRDLAERAAKDLPEERQIKMPRVEEPFIDKEYGYGVFLLNRGAHVLADEVAAAYYDNNGRRDPRAR